MATVLPHEKPGPLAFWPVSTSKQGLCKPRCFAPIKYLSSDRIMTWCIRRLCSFSRSFTSRFQICDPSNTRWVAVENPRISVKIYPYLTATQQISVGSQFWQREVKDRLNLHNLYIHHVMIRSELRYLIGAKNVGTAKWTRGSVSTRPNNTGFRFGPGKNSPRHSGSGFWPGNDPNATKKLAKNRAAGGLPGPDANTRYIMEIDLSELDQEWRGHRAMNV